MADNKAKIMLEKAEDLSLDYKLNQSSQINDLILLDNVQFIYELSLAKLELKALGDKKMYSGKDGTIILSEGVIE